MVLRITLSSHDSVGLGHVRRNLAIAHALTESLPALTGEPVTGILITGQASATSFPAPSGWDWVVVPSITVCDGGYTARHLAAGIDRVTAMRGAAVMGVLRAFRPDLFVADRHAFGARNELADALRMLRRDKPACVTVLGLRDVLDAPAVAAAEFAALGGARAIREFYDAIWVYGDPGVHDVTMSGEVPTGLRDLAVHTGYLAHGRPATTLGVPKSPFVLTTVGGGSDGGALAEAAARATPPPGHRHLVVTGPQMPRAQRAAIRAVAHKNTIVKSTVRDMLGTVRAAAGVVSMGGYNTVAEVMTTGTPSLVVPRVGRRDEQRIRAAALARTGAIETLPAREATTDDITDFFARSVGAHAARDHIDLHGLAAVAPLAAGLLAASRDREEAMSYAG